MSAKNRSTKISSKHPSANDRTSFSPPAMAQTVVLPPAHLLNNFDVVIPSASDSNTLGVILPPAHLPNNSNIVIPIPSKQDDASTVSSPATDDDDGDWKNPESTKAVHRSRYFPAEATGLTPDRPLGRTWSEYLQAHQLDMAVARAKNMVAGEDPSTKSAELNHLLGIAPGNAKTEYLHTDQLERTARIFKLIDEEKELKSNVNKIWRDELLTDDGKRFSERGKVLLRSTGQ